MAKTAGLRRGQRIERTGRPLLIEPWRRERSVQLLFTDKIDIPQPCIGLLQIVRHQLHYVGTHELKRFIQLCEHR